MTEKLLWLLQMHSEWELTNRMFHLLFTTICRRTSKPIIRKQAEQVVTAPKQTASCFTTGRMYALTNFLLIIQSRTPNLLKKSRSLFGRGIWND